MYLNEYTLHLFLPLKLYPDLMLLGKAPSSVVVHTLKQEHLLASQQILNRFQTEHVCGVRGGGGWRGRGGGGGGC